MALELDSPLRVTGIDFDGNRLLLIVGGLLAIYAVATCTLDYISVERKFWRNQRWIGLHSLIFSKAQAGFYAIRHTRELVERGYEKVPALVPKCDRSMSTDFIA